MKKFLSLILVFVLTIGISVPCAYAESSELPDFSAITGEFEFSGSDGTHYKYYFKNGKILVEGQIISDEIKIKINALFDGDYLYLYLPSFPLFHIKFDVSEFGYSGWEDIELTKVDYVKSYYEEIGNTEYYVDEFMYETEITKYYYLNGRLVFWETTDDDYTSTVTLISADVDDKTVEIPFYSIDVTFIFNWIFGQTVNCALRIAN